MNPDLTLTVTGSPEEPMVTLRTRIGVTWTRSILGVIGIPGGYMETIALEGDILDRLAREDRHRLLRRARRLLGPGGRLIVPVGAKAGRYPRQELEKEAWVCGFDAKRRMQGGLAVLTKPRRELGDEPAVSILIPAYKSEHFAAALDSALGQTWPRGEIIVADDSPDDTVAGLVAAARERVPAGWTLRYQRNPGTIGGRRNYLQLFDMAAGPLVKYLNDDDLLAPHCVESMARALMEHPDATLVTSYRRLIDGQDAPLPDKRFNEPILEEDALVDGRQLANLVLSKGINRIGEPTTTMFRKADVLDNSPHLMSYAGRSARRNGDVTIWIALLSRGDGIWLREPLSSFRRHAGQFQRDETFRSEAKLAWVELQADGMETGLVSPTLDELTPRPLVDGATVSGLMDQVAAAFDEGDMATIRCCLERILVHEPGNWAARGYLARLSWWDGDQDYAVLGAALALDGEADPELAADLKSMLVEMGMAPQTAEAIEARACGSDHARC